ncbi:uncharacterized protein FOMMEDRAFT_97735 [Fomitiporia mediterranea MF3/22]|uniref:uncharacterized protein n=1 Tax=Fomitiporia mediterranea (strain MF3/22) TaxID=694068 RepID=UPI00044074EE|nr:uncharacterized protein FOMMEDRAFT_97735 [Fomitiporia mediterranea MF3/22]EJC98117.1 hypothetical protein FOMMEDRAFT_97735 [Fomitiporia mediterranea MF3/22]
MAQDASRVSRHELEARLKQLRDVPVNTAGSQDRDMIPLHEHLMGVKPDSDGLTHWFCPRAELLTQELATFLLRLHAYTNDKVDKWRKQIIGVWRGCADCIRCMDEVKGSSRTTYFGAFSDTILSGFWHSFEEFEVKTIVEALTEAGITPESDKSLADISSPVLYHILSKPSALGHPFILGVISSQPFLPRSIDWPIDPPPPAYFLLIVYNDVDIRNWALDHVSKAEPIAKEYFDYRHYRHELALRLLSKRLNTDTGLNDSIATQTLTQTARNIEKEFPFAQSPSLIWAGFASVLRLLPMEVYEKFALHRIIMGHLHDNGPHFREVLRCLLQTLKKLGNKIWSEESADYPQVVFDSIKDNPSYIDLIFAHNQQKEQAWFLMIFLEYLRSVWEMQIFEDIVARFAAFTCDELQHERFGQQRPLVMSIAMQILSSALQRANKLKSPSHRQSILNVLDIHFDLIVAVCFSQQYAKSEWAPARSAALSLVRNVLFSDVEQVAIAAVKLSAMEASVDSETIRKLAPSVRKQVWWKVYTNLSGKDVEGISMLLDLAARSARLDKLSKKVASRTIWKYYDANQTKPPRDLLEAVDAAVDSVNSSLTIVRNGFLDAVTKFANLNSSPTLMKAICQHDWASHLVILLLSPVEDLQVAAQTLIGQTYDVDVRTDCFREILKAFPESSFKGLYEYLSEFNTYALKVAEACSVSKALVRCMTDVIEVLGNSPDGLLKNPAYVKTASESFSFKTELPKLWKAMTTSIAVIFKRTPKWAVYFDNNVMTEWMRDALIFARDLLERRRTFEAATSEVQDDDDIISSPRKPSGIGKKMVEDLQDVLMELQGWLRLTDTELLYQSFALLKSLFQCFRAANVKPSDEVLAKLSKFIEQNKTSSDAKRVSFLNKADLAELEVAVADFTEEDEVELVSVKLGKRRAFGRESSTSTTSGDARAERKRAKIELKIQDISKRPLKGTKQTKLISGKLSLPVAQKSTRIPEMRVSEPILRKQETKYEGSRRPRPAASTSSIPASPSSSSSSDSEDSDGPTNLASLINKAKEQKERAKEKEKQLTRERRKVQHIEDPRVKQARLEEERRRKEYEAARRAAMRLKPDITSLHRVILSWNYDHDGSDPPMERPPLAHVPDMFKSHEEYTRIFRPLLMLEAWSQIVKSKEERTPEIFHIKIAARSLMPPWLDLEVVIDAVPGPEWYLSPETDIVLLRHMAGKPCIMAKVTSFRKTNDEIGCGLRVCTNALNADPGLSIGSTWRLNLVLTTLHREYAALMALPYYDMVDIILQPRLADPVIPSGDELQRTMKAYRVNEPQAKAIISSMQTKGFSLIQGPPGTGKTWTILGLVGAFLSSRRTPPKLIAIPGKAPPPAPKPASQKLLICAPSNAAVDEITKRLIEGVRGPNGQRLSPKVVRVGADSQINVSAKEVSLDTLVEAKMNSDGGNPHGDGAGDAKNLRAELEQVKEARQKKIEELQSTINNTSRIQMLENEIRGLNDKRIGLSQKLNQLRDKMKSQNRSIDAIRRKYRHEILGAADIICSTLSGAGHEQLEPFDFSMVIIDEAAQSIELSSLIPLKYTSTRCVMVGDPQQLPPTVLSPEASKWGYDQSLFVRLQKCRPEAVHLLSIQYRMHPEISLLPSKVFYGGRLRDGPDMDKKTEQLWHNEPRFGAYKFFSVENGKEEQARIGHSIYNQAECRTIIAAYDRLRKQFSSINFDYRVGIVSPYRSQVLEMRKLFTQRFGAEIVSKVDFNTVDGFQGQEKDIIMLSCVRAGTSLATVGFLADIRRMNVAITRARSSLFIFGHAPTLQRSNRVWKDIVDDARSRACFVELVRA